VNSGLGRWRDRRAFRICVDFDFDNAFGPPSKAVKPKLLFEHGAAEVDGSSIRQAAEFVDELAYSDDRGMDDCLAIGLTHGVTPPLCY
jgi:hypothetical protein